MTRGSHGNSKFRMHFVQRKWKQEMPYLLLLQNFHIIFLLQLTLWFKSKTVEK